MPLIGSDKPRRHHYLFGHRDLRLIKERYAGSMPAMIEAGRMDHALAQSWDAVGEQLGPHERLDGAGLTATLHRVTGGQIVLITLPRAEHTTEAHFAAITLVNDQHPRYFVLEHSWALDDSPSTVLGEWNDRGHWNLGPGPDPLPEEFLAAVEDRLELAR